MNCSRCVCVSLPIYTEQLNSVDVPALASLTHLKWPHTEKSFEAESWNVVCPHEKTPASLTPLRITHLGRLGCLGWEGTRLYRVRLSAGEDQSGGRGLKSKLLVVFFHFISFVYFSEETIYHFCQQSEIYFPTSFQFFLKPSGRLTLLFGCLECGEQSSQQQDSVTFLT